MNHLDDYMTFMKLPKDLRARISSYYQARYAGKWFDEKDILNWVSTSLKEVWCSHIFHLLIFSIDILKFLYYAYILFFLLFCCFCDF